MKNQIKIFKRMFTRQTGADDCGRTCLAMILKYCGKHADAIQLLADHSLKGAASLVDLRKMAADRGFSTRCVEFDLDTFSEQRHPVIMHVIGDAGLPHFVIGMPVHSAPSCFMIADPAHDICLLSANELDGLWQSKAALYFENILPAAVKGTGPVRKMLVNRELLPVAILVASGFAAIGSMLMGIALTWLLQEGINNPGIFHGRVVVEIVVLLMLIGAFKGTLSYLRQYLAIRVSLAATTLLAERKMALQVLGFDLLTLQKAQDAVTAIVNIVAPDTALMLCLLSGIFYLLPVAGFINMVYVITLLGYALYRAPQEWIAKNGLERIGRLLERRMQQWKENPNERKYKQDFSTMFLGKIRTARLVALRLSKRYSAWEMASTLIPLLVLILCIDQENHGHISYQTLIVLVIGTFFNTTLSLRIATAIQPMAEGAYALELLLEI